MLEHGVTMIDVKLAPRLTREGRAFTEIFIKYSEAREVVEESGDITVELGIHQTLSRVNYTMADTPHSRSFVWQQFLQRRERCNQRLVSQG
jgi:hypothetical protein